MITAVFRSPQLQESALLNMERELALDQYIVLCDILFQGFHKRFVDFAPHLTSSYYSMLTAPACPHVRIPGKQLRNKRNDELCSC